MIAIGGPAGVCAAISAARHDATEHPRMRNISAWEYGYWWISWGGRRDPARDQERIRFELLSIVMGVWEYIKNGGDHPTSKNWAMDGHPSAGFDRPELRPNRAVRTAEVCNMPP